MAITIHPARRQNEDVPPGTWEGTKQDAVLATAQLQEIWERKKRGERVKFGHNEYDAQMANAQLRAFKLTKAMLRNARRNSASDTHKKIEDMGFIVETGVKGIDPPIPGPPPSAPLPAPPQGNKRSKTSREPVRNLPVQMKAASAPVSPIRPPTVPKKAINRQSSLPPLVNIPRRQSSIEASQRKAHLPPPSSRVPSPIPSGALAPKLSPPPFLLKSPATEKDALPVLPFRRKPVPKSTLEPMRSSRPTTTPAPDSDDPPVPPRSPYRASVYGSGTPPLIPKRRSLQRSISFRFGEGLQHSISKSLYSELSSALDDLQRSLAGTTVEVH